MNQISIRSFRSGTLAAIFSFAVMHMLSAHALTTNVAGNIASVSGGVTIDERQEMSRMRNNYSLLVKLAAKSGKYMGDAMITIINAKGATIFEGSTDGPWLMVNLAPGTYTVSATIAGTSQTQKVTIGNNTRREMAFRWNVDDVQ